jgi:hypothetical protein
MTYELKWREKFNILIISELCFYSLLFENLDV